MRSERMASTFSFSSGLPARGGEEFFSGALIEGGGMHFVCGSTVHQRGRMAPTSRSGTTSFQIRACTFRGAMKSSSVEASA